MSHGVVDQADRIDTRVALAASGPGSAPVVTSIIATGGVRCVHSVHMSAVLEEPVRAVRSHLSEVIDRAASAPTIITRHGKRVAAVVSIDLLRRYEELDEQDLVRVIEERLANPAPGIPLEEVMRETLARDD